MVQVTDGELKIILNIIKNHAKDCEVYVFGSRLNGTKKAFSDLDLAFKCKKVMGYKKIGDLDEEFDESDLPYRVDVVDYNNTSKEFQEIIDKSKKKIYG